MSKVIFRNHNKDMPYKTFLYKRIDGKVKSKIFVGEESAQKGLESGWVMSVGDFVDEVAKDSDLNDDQKEDLKITGDEFSRDADLLANCEQVEDVQRLKDAYARVSGKDLNNNITSIKTVRTKCLELLGDLEENQE